MSCVRVKGCFLKQGNDWHSAPPSFSARNLLYAKSIGQENKIDRMWLTAALLDLDRRAPAVPEAGPPPGGATPLLIPPPRGPPRGHVPGFNPPPPRPLATTLHPPTLPPPLL